MFYIDFTTPEGKLYRIELANTPITYECPRCGKHTTYTFKADGSDYCAQCLEDQQRRIEEEEMNQHMNTAWANHLNREYNCNLTPDDMRLFWENVDKAEDPDEYMRAFVESLEAESKIIYPLPPQYL